MRIRYLEFQASVGFYIQRKISYDNVNEIGVYVFKGHTTTKCYNGSEFDFYLY